MKALRRYLEDEGMTQKQLAEKLGVKQPSVNDWLTGRKYPTGPRLRDIARCTGLSVDSLLGIPARRAR